MYQECMNMIQYVALQCTKMSMLNRSYMFFFPTILEVEEELEALKRKYQKNMALVSRQSKAR